MELSKIPTLVVGLIVAILIVTVVAIPIIDDASKEIKTSRNNTTQTFFVSDADDDPIVITANNTGSYSINGESFSDNGLIVINEGFMVKYAGTNLQIRNLKDTTYNYDEPSSQASQSITISDGVVTTGAGKSFTYTGDVLYKSSNGTYGQTTYGQDFYIDNDAIIYTDLPLNFGTSNYSVNMIVMGTWQNLKATAACNYSSSTGTLVDLSDISLQLNGVKEDTAVSALAHSTSITVTFDNGESTQSGTATGTRYFWAPIEYHTITQNDSAMISIINVIPILLIVTLLVSIVGAVFVRTR